MDGDNPAAMRYTEARLTAVAEAMLAGIDEDAVDFRETYDGEEREPAVLPARFPNLLANGAAGIAVGMATSIPPHNVDEVCAALLHLIRFPNARVDKLAEFVRGPDFPTGGVLVEPRGSIVETYRTGRGGFRLRARWEVERLSHGQYQIVVTEIPYQVAKSRLIERIAELVLNRKLPWLTDVRDESTDEVRIVLEPRNRTVDADLLMEQLFRQTDLETRFGLNMNVLDATRTPRVMGLRDVLRAFLDHRHQVLERRARHRLDRIEGRLEVLGGLLVAYVNLDRVIRIVREEEAPRPVLMAAFDLTEVQADAILNMRLRQLRRLEEAAIRREDADLKVEREGLEALLGDEKRRWAAIAEEVADIRRTFGAGTDLGRRRTEIGEAPSAVVVPIDVMVAREPITVIHSEKGWIRSMKGHVAGPADVKYKEGDRGRFLLHAQTTDRLVVFATNGRFYTVGCDKLPGGRGHGEPIRLMVDLEGGTDVVALLIHRADRRLLVASDAGRGFLVAAEDVVAQTRGGRQVLNLGAGEEAAACAVVEREHDSVAVVGDNRKLLVFPLGELPEMGRGRGVILQRYREGGLSDATTFRLDEGLAWKTGGRTRRETDLLAWQGRRAGAGRLAPRGFSSANRFT